MTSAEPSQNKTWELSLYELHRNPQEVITDSTEIAVSPRSLHSELMCPICLDMLKKTMTTKECLHRFCSDCIITALRSGNKECPTCRKKLVSKRSLRPDPNFDLLISKIYPSRDEYEAHQEHVLAKLNMSHSQASLINSITEGIKLQSQNRPQRLRKNQEEGNSASNSNGNTENPQSEGTSSAPKDGTSSGNPTPSGQSTSNPASVRSTPSPVPSNVSSMSKNTSTTKRAKSILTSERSEESESSDSRTEGENSMDTEGEEPLNPNEIELVFKPHPTEMIGDNQLMRTLRDSTVRYIKTTANASVDHLSKYLAMRLTLDLDAELPEAYRLLNFCIYVAPQPGQFVPLNGAQTLRQINDKFWKVNVNKPLEMYYSFKKT